MTALNKGDDAYQEGFENIALLHSYTNLFLISQLTDLAHFFEDGIRLLLHRFS
jgi:hypothetical protein